MKQEYEATKGSYKKQVVKLTTITDVQAPTLFGIEVYEANHTTQFKTKDQVDVVGVNGSVNVGIGRPKYTFRERLKTAYNLIRGRGVSVVGGAPNEEQIKANPIIKSYVDDSKAFQEELAKQDARTKVLSNKKFEVSSKGVKEVPLEKRL